MRSEELSVARCRINWSLSSCFHHPIVGRGLDLAVQLNTSTTLKFETPCRGRYFLVQTRKYPKNLPKGRFEKAPPWEFRFAVPSISCAHFVSLLLADRCTSRGSLSPPPAAVASFAPAATPSSVQKCSDF